MEINRRAFITSTAAGATVLASEAVGSAQARSSRDRDLAPPGSLAAQRPTGFTPFTAPGLIVRINKRGSMRANSQFPRADAAAEMVNRGVRELTGAADVTAAWRQFVHPQDRVGIKLNGIAGRNMATSKEVVLAIVQGLTSAGVPGDRITIYEQYLGFLNACRVTPRDVPTGVRFLVHANREVGARTRVPSGRTAYANAMLDCTAVINVPLVKDHSICGFTGAMKNMTHGSLQNPEAFHLHQASPQIAELYAHEAIRTRVRLHVMDAFKVMYDGGPLYHNPQAVVPYEALFVSTDPVALDRIGADIVDGMRQQHNMQSLERRGDPPRYIDHAASLGLGIADRTRIDVRTIDLT